MKMTTLLIKAPCRGSHLTRGVWVSLALLSCLALSACEREGAGSSGRGALLTGAPQEAQPTGANLDELAPTLSLRPAQASEVAASDVEAGDVEAGDVEAGDVEAGALAAGEGALTLFYAQREGQVSPRTAELFVRYPTELSFVSAQAGEALTLAGKDLVVQTPSEGRLRVVVMSTGHLNTLSSGALATFTWRGPREALDQVRLEARATYFAPAEANVGVTLSPSDEAPNNTPINTSDDVRE